MELRPLIPWGRTTAIVIVLPFVGHLLTASLVAEMAKHLPAMRETWVLFLGWEDPLEKEKATHSSTLAWRIPWSRKESDTTERLSLSLSYFSPNTFHTLLFLS